MNKIGVIGNGFVGSAVAEGFKHYADVKVYDSNPNKSPDNFQDVLQQECIFICVPTPMSEGGGQCDMSYIYDVFDKVKHLITESIFIIKSTVPVGTTSQLKSKYPKLHIIHSPEFLTARTAKIDFITPSRVIVGYPKEFYSKLFFSEKDLKELDKLGHIVGLHSHSHPTLMEKLTYKVNTILSKLLKLYVQLPHTN